MSATDSTNKVLLACIDAIQSPSLWYADENALELIPLLVNKKTKATTLLHIVTNRYDIYQQLKQGGFEIVFSDFNPREYPWNNTFETIIYRASKEKALVHHILNQVTHLLSANGEFIFLGKKKDGIKTYQKKMIENFNAIGKLKKQGTDYIGHFSGMTANQPLDDENYNEIRKIAIKKQASRFFYSKPGIFGWDKVDKGSQILVDAINQRDINHDKPYKLLDLGCGYGWLFLNLPKITITSLTATDNNAAALLAAEKNKAQVKFSVSITASDAGDNIEEKFDWVLCNPPFHQGYQHNQALTQKFILSAANHLNKGGEGFFVVNEFIGLEKLAQALFANIQCLEKKDGFKVYYLQK